jgi:hypothetical protein
VICGLLQVVGNNYQRKLLEIIDARYIFFAGSEFEVVLQCVPLLAWVCEIKGTSCIILESINVLEVFHLKILNKH